MRTVVSVRGSYCTELHAGAMENESTVSQLYKALNHMIAITVGEVIT